MGDNRHINQCPCTFFRSCPWSSQLMKHVVNLPKYHPFRRFLINYFKARTCSSINGGVYCCNPINQGTTTTATTAKTTTTIATATKRVQDLGTWQPKQGEC